MLDIQVDGDGVLRCASCGGKNFSAKRTTRAKVGGGAAAVLTLGVAGAAAPLLTAKKLWCQQCGTYNKMGNAQPFGAPQSAPARESTPGEEVFGVVVLVGITIAALAWFIASGWWVLTGIAALILAFEVLGLAGMFLGAGAPKAPPAAPPVPARPEPAPTLPPGWYPDALQPGRERYWSGIAWTSQTR